MTKTINIFLLLCLLSLTASDTVNAHGYLSIPPSRNILAKDQYCPHCLNGGTSYDVSAKKTLRWPKGNHGLCGDSYYDVQPRNHEAGGMYYQKGLYTNYTQGQVMDIEVVTTTNHNGRLGFRICKIGGGYDGAEQNEKNGLTEECFDQHVLQQAEGSQMAGEEWFYSSPSDPVSYTYKMKYKLPDDLVCDGQESHCVLQWYWLTFNSCQTPDAPVKYTRASQNMRDCGSGNDTSATVTDSPYPEEFWNCADITIQGSEVSAAVDWWSTHKLLMVCSFLVIFLCMQ